MTNDMRGHKEILGPQEAFQRGLAKINARAAEEGHPPVRTNDYAVIAAFSRFDGAYERALLKMKPHQVDQFNIEAVDGAMILICRAILADKALDYPSANLQFEET